MSRELADLVSATEASGMKPEMVIAIVQAKMLVIQTEILSGAYKTEYLHGDRVHNDVKLLRKMKLLRQHLDFLMSYCHKKSAQKN